MVLSQTVTPRKELIVIYRQEIMKDIRLFTAQPVAKFYDSLFLNLDLSFVHEYWIPLP